VSTRAGRGLERPVVYGFLARSVADTALLYEVATGTRTSPPRSRSPGKLRIALSLKSPPELGALHPDWLSRRGGHRRAVALAWARVVERDPAIRHGPA